MTALTPEGLAERGLLVKPLEWGHGEAHCPLGVYKIDSGQASAGGRWWSWALNPDENDPFFMWQNANNADSEEAAKAAAQADYEARILAVLDDLGEPPAVQAHVAKAVAEAEARGVERAEAIVDELTADWFDPPKRYQSDRIRNALLAEAAAIRKGETEC